MNISGDTVGIIVSLIIGSAITVIVQLVARSVMSHRDQGLKLIRKEEIEETIKLYLEETKHAREKEVEGIVSGCIKDLNTRVNEICRDIRQLAIKEINGKGRG